MIGLALFLITISALSAAVSLGRIERMLRKMEKREAGRAVPESGKGD